MFCSPSYKVLIIIWELFQSCYKWYWFLCQFTFLIKYKRLAVFLSRGLHWLIRWFKFTTRETLTARITLFFSSKQRTIFRILAKIWFPMCIEPFSRFWDKIVVIVNVESHVYTKGWDTDMLLCLLCCKPRPTVQYVAHATYPQSCDCNTSAWQSVHLSQVAPFAITICKLLCQPSQKVSEENQQWLQGADACQEDFLLPLKKLPVDPYLLESP